MNQFIDRPTAKDPEEAKAFIQKIRENKSYYWGITLKENGKMIGTVCLWNLSADRKSAELGYELHPDYQRKGYMDEAIKEVIGFAFRSGFTSLEAYTHRDNLASTKLLLKHGFVHDEEKRPEPLSDDILPGQTWRLINGYYDAGVAARFCMTCFLTNFSGLRPYYSRKNTDEPFESGPSKRS